MATIKNGIIGPFSGRVGSVVGSRWRKIPYIKGNARDYSNKGKPSEKQLAHYKKFGLLNQFLAKVPAVLEVGFGNFTQKRTGCNAAFQYNFDHAFIEDEQGEPVLNYPALQFSRGALAPAGGEKAVMEDGHIKISWNTKTYGLGGAMDDELHILVCEPDDDRFGGTVNRSQRYKGETSISWDPSGGPIHIWLFWSDSSRKKVSPTVYLSI